MFIAILQEYARVHNLSTSDLSWAMQTQKNSAKGVWVEISRALPHRTARSIYGHGIRMLHEGNHVVRAHVVTVKDHNEFSKWWWETAHVVTEIYLV